MVRIAAAERTNPPTGAARRQDSSLLGNNNLDENKPKLRDISRQDRSGLLITCLSGQY
jgi:hypothetical protein